MGGYVRSVAVLITVVLFLQGCSLLLNQPEQQPPVKKVPQQAQPQQSVAENKPPEELAPPLEESVIGPFPHETAPAFTILLTSGKIVSSRDLIHDKAVVLYFFTTSCTVCLRELNAFKQPYLKDRNTVEVIAMSVESKETVRDVELFRKRHLYNFDFATFQEGIISSFQATTPGLKIAVDANGTVTARETREFEQNDWNTLLKTVI